MHGCPVKRAVVGCLQMDAYWAPGPCGGRWRRGKETFDWTPLCVAVVFPLAFNAVHAVRNKPLGAGPSQLKPELPQRKSEQTGGGRKNT